MALTLLRNGHLRNWRDEHPPATTVLLFRRGLYGGGTLLKLTKTI
jgi:hypothetical protein